MGTRSCMEYDEQSDERFGGCGKGGASHEGHYEECMACEAFGEEGMFVMTTLMMMPMNILRTLVLSTFRTKVIRLV